MEFGLKYRIAVILVISFFIGYFFGEIHFHNPLSFQYNTFKKIFTEIIMVAEFFYYILASCIIIFAYLQYTDSKRQAKREKAEFAHELFGQYVDDVLILDKNYDYQTLRTLTNSAPKEEKEKFNKMLNKIDTIAAAFIHDLADKPIGNKLFGNIYLDQISSYEAAIKRIYGDKYRERFDNMFRLYELWSDR